MPKFRGSGDDWLDEEKASKRQSAADRKKKGAPRAEVLPAEEANATVAEVFPKQCRARMDSDGAEVLCSYRRANVFPVFKTPSGEEWRERSPVAVGDRVKASLTGTKDGVIEGVSARANQLVRPAPGRDEGNVHVLAANVDVLCIVAAASNPDFSPGLVDRFLIAATAAGIPCVIAVNKIDLFSGMEHSWAVYREIGIPAFELSAKRCQGVEELRAELSGKRAVFCGHSGVGKTSLLKALSGRDVGRIGDVSELTGKGRHTTTGAVLIEGPEGSQWIDTPGVREFGLLGIDPEGLLDFYPELQACACADEVCRHQDEAGCSARDLVRYASYRRILESLRSGER